MDKNSNGIVDLVTNISLKIFWGLVLFFVAAYVIDSNTSWLKPDYNQPHEYLSVEGFGNGWMSMEGNDHTFLGSALTKYKDNFFPIGEGRCFMHLRNISDDQVRIAMEGFNYFLASRDDWNDIRVAHVKIQCVEYSGRDKQCEERAYKSANPSSDPRSIAIGVLLSQEACEKKRPIGSAKIISLNPP